MAANNFKLFDENKQNMLSDQEYQASQQRLGGVQAGIASSMLNNKFAYQMSLIAYAIAQMMNANGYDATDALAVSAFVGNLSNSVLQKVIDKATTAEAQAGTNTLKWMTPALVKSFFDYRLATQAEAQAGTDNSKWMSPLRVAQAMASIKNDLASLWRYARSKRWTLNLNRTSAGLFSYTVPADVYQLGITIVGGGQAGFGGIEYNGSSYTESISAQGGRAGHVVNFVMAVAPGQVIQGVVGAGGVSVAVSMQNQNRVGIRTESAPGGTTSFGGFEALGGGVVKDGLTYGLAPDNVTDNNKSGTVVSSLPSPVRRRLPFSVRMNEYSAPTKLSADDLYAVLFDDECWFEPLRFGAAGAGAAAIASTEGTAGVLTQLGSSAGGGKAGDSVGFVNGGGALVSGGNATGVGNGGGAAAREHTSFNSSLQVKGGNGAPGAVRIYVETGV